MPVRPGDLTFAHVQRYVDAVVTVDDPADRRRRAVDFEHAKMVAEPSGAATTAAVLSGAVDAAIHVEGPIVAIVSGGNMGSRRSRTFAAPVTPSAMHSPQDREPPMIELFEMERMQSTWENLVDYDMSESGVRPLTLRELVAMGFDLEAFLDQPLGYSQSNGTIELRERLAAALPRRARSITSRSPTAPPKRTTSSR